MKLLKIAVAGRGLKRIVELQVSDAGFQNDFQPNWDIWEGARSVWVKSYGTAFSGLSLLGYIVTYN